MSKHLRILYLALYVFFALLPVGTAQTLPPEALDAVHRIQVVAVSDDKPLEAAEAFAKDFSAALDLRAYVIHKDGWYKVLLGDFTTKSEMRADLKRVKTRVKDAWPVTPENEKIIAIWQQGKRMDFSQAEPSPTATPEPEIPRPRAIREEPRIELKAEDTEARIPSLEKEQDKADSQAEMRKHNTEPEERELEVFATPTPLPGVVEEDLLATPATSLDEIIELDLSVPEKTAIVLPDADKEPVEEQPEAPETIVPTPAPTVSLTLTEFMEGFETHAVPPKPFALPETAPEKIDDVLPEPPSKDVFIDIDDLQLDDVLGKPDAEAELPFVIPAPDENAVGSVEDRQMMPSPPTQPSKPVLVKISADDSRLLAIGFADGRLELWNLDAKALRFRNFLHSGRICDLSFNFKAQHLSSLSVDGSLKVWTLKDGIEQQSLNLTLADIQDAKFDHAHARVLVLHQNRLTTVDPSEGQARQIFPAGEFLKFGDQQLGERDRLVCPPKADSALAFDLDCCAPVLFQQLAGGIELALPQLFNTPLSAAVFSSSGDFFAVGRGKLVDLEPGKTGVEVYQFLPSGKKQAVSIEFLLEAQSGLEHEVSSLAFSPRSSILLVGHEGGGLQLFQLFSKLPSGKNPAPELSARAGKVLRNFEGHSARVSSLAFFPDGKRFASVSDDGTLRIWDVASAKELERLNFE